MLKWRQGKWLLVYFFHADHYVVINLRQDGKVIGTKETKGACGPNPVWNAPFLFDMPAGDITQLPLVLEFIVMQVRASRRSVCPVDDAWQAKHHFFTVDQMATTYLKVVP